jgi:transcriptional regulator with XRE-family HTH domain
MNLAEKLRYLRTIEGQLRGLDREMTQQEVVRAISREMKKSISQPYLSQIESGKRQHLTNSTRLLLAKFFKVHPGFLVSDPEGYHTELQSDLRLGEDQLDLWLVQGADRFSDPRMAEALLAVARHPDSRKCLLLIGAILKAPELVERLWDVLKPGSEQLAANDVKERFGHERN